MLDLSFPNVTSGGATTVNALSDSATANFTLSENLGAYDIKTTATYDTSGYNTDPTKGIKITFSVLAVNNQSVFDGLVITHGEDLNNNGTIEPSEMIPYNGLVEPNKVTHDFASRTIWVYVPSLSPFVIVKAAADQIQDLIRLVRSFNLKQGIANSLDSKLQNAQNALAAARAGDKATACNQINSFINEVQAQTGKAVTVNQSKQLNVAAKQIKVVLGCLR